MSNFGHLILTVLLICLNSDVNVMVQLYGNITVMDLENVVHNRMNVLVWICLILI